MVEVFFPPIQGSSLRIKVTGHAGSAPKGKDLVCAAVSSLLYTMVGGMEQQVRADVVGTFQDGLCDLRLTVEESRSMEFASIGSVFRFGFAKLAQNYPSHIRVNFESQSESQSNHNSNRELTSERGFSYGT